MSTGRCLVVRVGTRGSCSGRAPSDVPATFSLKTSASTSAAPSSASTGSQRQPRRPIRACARSRKALCRLMFGVLALTVAQLMQFVMKSRSKGRPSRGNRDSGGANMLRATAAETPVRATTAAERPPRLTGERTSRPVLRHGFTRGSRSVHNVARFAARATTERKKRGKNDYLSS